jgi:hypothetical protein
MTGTKTRSRFVKGIRIVGALGAFLALTGCVVYPYHPYYRPAPRPYYYYPYYRRADRAQCGAGDRRSRRASTNCQVSRVGTPNVRSRDRLRSDAARARSGGMPNTAPSPA